MVHFASQNPQPVADTEVVADQDWRLRAMDAPDFVLSYAIEGIRRQVAHWIEFDKAGRDREGLATTPDTHIVCPPCWPSHGQLAAWVALFERVEKTLAEATTASAGGTKGEARSDPQNPTKRARQ